MTFRDFDIKISYTGSSYAKIINPLLSCAKIYRRNAGFFSSSVFDFISDGVINMAKNGGKIYLATSPRLSNSDIDAISKGYKDKELMAQSVMPELYTILDSMSDDNVKFLYTLVKDGVLDIKIVLPKYGMYDYGIYHDKLALLEDYDGNIVICSGSANETGAAYSGVNYERMRVYTNWDDSKKRIDDEISEFIKIWDNTNEDLIVYNFNSALEKDLLERENKEGRYKKHVISKDKSNDAPVEMRDYQIEAKNKWIENGYKGFFVMATGTGKTFTALYSIREFVRTKRIFTVIVVPYKHLARQWAEDIKVFLPEADVHEIHSEIKGGETKIYSSYINASKKKYKPIIVITTIRSFLLSRYVKIYDMIDFERLLIVDEAHNFYNQLNNDLSYKYPYKMGLSATPVMGSDSEKTTELLTWFGGQIVNLPIEDAIGKYLVNYEYHPIFVDATEDDEEGFNRGSALMAQAMKSGKIVDEEKFLKGRRARLRAISLAENKTSSLPKIFSQIKEKDHTIIYCSDGKLSDEYGKIENPDDQIKHLDYVLRLINDPILNTDNGKASRFTASENVDERMKLISAFNNGFIQYLVAIRCLDEGINIPSIKAALILSSNDNYREFVQRRGRILRLYEGKEVAHIYDIIVLPSMYNSKFAEIELRRYNEYAKLALNHDDLLFELDRLLDSYNLKYDDIKFKNEYINGGDLDE